mgnify:CR=1 FL=1
MNLTTTIEYNGKQVVPVKLVLIEVPIKESIGFVMSEKHIKPIFISETEPIKKGDNIYSKIKHNGFSDIGICEEINDDEIKVREHDGRYYWTNRGCNKIISLPEQLSPETLKLIADGVIKEGEELYLECEEIWKGIKPFENYESIQLKLTPENHVVLVPMESIWDELDADMEDSGMAQGEIVSCINHWQNKYIITRK